MWPTVEEEAKEVSSEPNSPAKLKDTSALLPLKDSTSDNSFKGKTIKKVSFHEDACVAEHFESVLKTYRILRPNTIELENQDLRDEHLILLVNFMKNLEMVKSINLRKNKIGNAGAKAFAEFIMNHD